MKGLLLTICGILLTTFLFAQQGDNGTAGYSSGATMGLIIVIVLVVVGIAGFTWRKKEKPKE